MFDFSALFSAEGLVSLVSLTVMEIVLGIDNILWSRSCRRRSRRRSARGCGSWASALALVLRIGAAVRAVVADGADEAAVHACWATRSRGAIWCCSAGGLFLIYKATHELYERIETAAERRRTRGRRRARSPPASVATLAQILALDIVFSLDSVITAVGMARAHRR